MGKASLAIVLGSNRSMFLLLFVVFLAAAAPAHSFHIRTKDSNACPGSYERCSGSNSLSNFCCPSLATYVEPKGGGSVICCPMGQGCAYIKPIPCIASLQDPNMFPKGSVKASRLQNELPRCGGACCPFGYVCRDKNSRVTESESITTTTPEISIIAQMWSPAATSSGYFRSTSIAPEVLIIPPTTSPTISSDVSRVSIITSMSPLAASSVAQEIPVVLPTVSPAASASTIQTPLPALSHTPAENSQRLLCPAFPGKAVAAGFFPGAIFGVITALLSPFLLRRRQRQRQSRLPLFQAPLYKFDRSYYGASRSPSGVALGISNPIPSKESSYRTDFLLFRRGNVSPSCSRSVLSRTGSRVKSLFPPSSPLGSHRGNVTSSIKDTPACPTTPLNQIKVAPGRSHGHRHSQDMESIGVYPPTGSWPDLRQLRLQPRADVSTPETTFSQVLDRVGFQDGQGNPCFRVDEAPVRNRMRNCDQNS